MVDEYISKMKDGRSFSSNQIDFVKRFDRNLDIKGLSQSTRYSRIQRLFQVFETIGKDFVNITEYDVENFICKLKDSGVTDYTVENWKCVIRGFFKGFEFKFN